MSKYPMPQERRSITHRFVIGQGKDQMKVYLTVGLRENGEPGELFMTANKVGTLERGLMHTIALMVSQMLQSGIGLDQVVRKMKGVTFEPAGFVQGGMGIRSAKSVVDYVGQWLERRFLEEEKGEEG